MKNSESKKVEIVYGELKAIKEKITNMKIILVGENIKIDNMEQEVWELYLANKVLKEANDEETSQSAQLFLKTFIEKNPEDILYMLRNENVYTPEDAKKFQSEQKIEWFFDKPIKEEKFMNAWLDMVTLDMPILIRKRFL